MFQTQYFDVLFKLIMALLMSGVMSLAMSFFQLESSHIWLLLEAWLIAWGVSFLVALPMTFILSPIVIAIVNLLLVKPALVRAKQGEGCV